MNLRDAFKGLVCIFILVSLGCWKGIEDPPWAVSAGGPSKDQGSGVATFDDHSSIVVGSFEDTITIGSGQPNEIQFTSNGLVDIFVARFDRNGTLEWARQAGGIGEDGANSIAGFQDGSFVVSGSFYETATFGTGEANETDLISEESGDVFVAHYNADGTLAWVTRANGPSFEACRGIASFPDGSCALTGFFEDRLTFGEDEANQTNLISEETADVFIARYNADGTLAWAKQAGGANTCTGNGIASFTDGSCIVAMRIEGTATIGSGEVNEIHFTSYGDTDISVVRYEADGRLFQMVLLLWLDSSLMLQNSGPVKSTRRISPRMEKLMCSLPVTTRMGHWLGPSTPVASCGMWPEMSRAFLTDRALSQAGFVIRQRLVMGSSARHNSHLREKPISF